MTEPQAVSTRLIQVLRTYCHGLQRSALWDLHDSIATGHYRWLHDELHTALTQDAFTPEEWAQHVGAAPVTALGQRTMRQQQAQIWRILFPDDAYPGR